jgi:hypothetical protein
MYSRNSILCICRKCTQVCNLQRCKYDRTIEAFDDLFQIFICSQRSVKSKYMYTFIKPIPKCFFFKGWNIVSCHDSFLVHSVKLHNSMIYMRFFLMHSVVDVNSAPTTTTFNNRLWWRTNPSSRKAQQRRIPRMCR